MRCDADVEERFGRRGIENNRRVGESESDSVGVTEVQEYCRVQ